MDNAKEIQVISQKLTELKLKQKMLKWTFNNAKGMSEKQVNAILDEALRIDPLVKLLEKRLKELEK